MKATYRPVKDRQNHNIKSSGHDARSALLDLGTGTIGFWERGGRWGEKRNASKAYEVTERHQLVAPNFFKTRQPFP